LILNFFFVAFSLLDRGDMLTRRGIDIDVVVEVVREKYTSLRATSTVMPPGL
jgi:hypothetical protein